LKRRVLLTAVATTIVVAGAAMTVAVPTVSSTGASVPTARVSKSPLKLTVHATGDLRAGRTVTLVTPPIGGGTLRIIKLVLTGMPVRAGDVVMEFDPADQQYALDQARSELAEAEQEIVKMKADAEVQKAQDEVALLTARFDVRRAELDALGNEFIAAVNAKKNALSLEEARRRLAQLTEDVKSRAATNTASLAVVEEKRNKALLAMQRAQQVIESLVLRAPLDGVVSLKENRNAAGGMFFYGQVLPEYREGDQVFPGQPVADVIESGRMELRAKIDENDRGNLTEGQQASVFVDALPGEVFTARVGVLSGLASRANFFDAASVSRQFDVTFQFDRPDPRLKAGASARLVIEGKEIADALHVPRQAVFARAGRNHVFVRAGDRFEERDVKVTQRTESRVVIEGVAEGAEIALVDPTVRAAGASSSSSPAVPSASPR
jgi:multidrug efflux pump subunit AcrA (membrane-fusion protein)